MADSRTRPLLVAGSMLFPVLYWALRDRVGAPLLLAPVAVLVAWRAWAERSLFWFAIACLTWLLIALSAGTGSPLPVKFYPVLVNLGLLTVFAASLLRPPTVIERLARLQEPDLQPRAVAYTRRVTWVWCGFFLINGAAALGTSLWGSDGAWTLYNGFIAYLLMGLLFAGEWLVRGRVRAKDDHG